MTDIKDGAHSHTYNICDANGMIISSITSGNDARTLINKAFVHDDLVGALKGLMEIAGFYIEYSDEPEDIIIACDRVKAGEKALAKAGVTL